MERKIEKSTMNVVTLGIERSKREMKVLWSWLIDIKQREIADSRNT